MTNHYHTKTTVTDDIIIIETMYGAKANIQTILRGPDEDLALGLVHQNVKDLVSEALGLDPSPSFTAQRQARNHQNKVKNSITQQTPPIGGASDELP